MDKLTSTTLKTLLNTLQGFIDLLAITMNERVSGQMITVVCTYVYFIMIGAQ